jgi:ketosteroid isomerase-like protein
MSQENVELVRQAFEAFNRDDRATVIRLLAPDVEWHTLAGPILGASTVRGREAMLTFWEDIAGSIGLSGQGGGTHRSRHRSGPGRGALRGARPKQRNRGQHASRERLRDSGRDGGYRP